MQLFMANFADGDPKLPVTHRSYTNEFDAAFFEAFHEEEVEIRRNLPREIRAFFTEHTIQDENLPLPPAAVISVRTQSRIPVSWAPHLRAIITRSTGYDHILAYWREANVEIPSAYLPLYCCRAVAEHALLLWTALLRRLPAQLESFARFDRNGLTGGEINGRTLAVFGVGQIGREVADIGKALRMRVVGVDLSVTVEGLEFVSPEEALAQADVIVCAMNLTLKNRGYFNDNVWALGKPGAVFVNVSRGEISPFGPLRRALESGRLAGVGLDVFNEESNIAGFLRGSGHLKTMELSDFLALRRDPRVIFTPHNAFNSAEAVVRKSVQSVEQLEHFLSRGVFTTPVPFPFESCKL